MYTEYGCDESTVNSIEEDACLHQTPVIVYKVSTKRFHSLYSRWNEEQIQVDLDFVKFLIIEKGGEKKSEAAHHKESYNTTSRKGVK